MLESYCEIEDVDEYATRYAITEWQMMQPSEKAKAIFDATLDIINFHKQPADAGVPWEWTNDDLRSAAVLQCLYIARVGEQMNAGEKVKALTKGSYSDSILSASDTRGRHLSDQAVVYVRNVMRACGVSGSTAYEFNRT